jgi:hypothetical protein
MATASDLERLKVTAPGESISYANSIGQRTVVRDNSGHRITNTDRISDVLAYRLSQRVANTNGIDS